MIRLRPLALLVGFVATSSILAEPVTLVQDPAILAKVPLALSRFLGADGKPERNDALYQQSKAYRALVDSLAEDLVTLRLADPRLDVTMAKSHRLFDVRWLKSPLARFSLVGVVNRLDRSSFHPEKCGELRLVYRLAYTKGDGLSSRLPMTVNVVHWVPPGDCAAAARAWVPAGALTADWLVSPSGPLRPAALKPEQLKSVEVNLQSARWPSTTRPDLGAHAEYLLRVFKPLAGSLTLDRLENSPEVERLQRDPKALGRLKSWVAGHLDELDRGVALIPDEFLARKATSVSPRGLNRLANRPFKRLFSEADFKGLALSGRSTISTPAALLRRLDDLSCVGCHQGRSVAGFHLIGIDPPETLAANAIAVTGSPHLLLDQPRRAAFVSSLASGRKPKGDRPLSDRAESGEGGYGSHCGLGDAGFRAWSCNAGLVCKSVGLVAGDDSVGLCLPAGAAEVGDPCEAGEMIPSADSHRDRVVKPKSLGCNGGVCEVNRVGFPDGMCALGCGSPGPALRCGSIAILEGFNACLGAGKPFPQCLEANVRPAGLRACSDSQPCRDDYLCARGQGGGVCLPPYFLFQMRVDGHQKPL